MIKLAKDNEQVWKLSGLKGLSLQELGSVISQVLAEPDCPSNIHILDIEQTYSAADFGNRGAIQLLWK